MPSDTALDAKEEIRVQQMSLWKICMYIHGAYSKYIFAVSPIKFELSSKKWNAS